MSHQVTMPQLGFTMVEGTIAEWRKQEGEPVARGEILMEVTTEKVSVEVEARVGGVLQKILVPAGATVPVGTPVCLVAGDGESPAQEPEPSSREPQQTPGNGLQPRAALDSRAEATEEAEELRVKASGVAKRLAREQGIALEAVRGSGPGGRIMEADVLRYLEERRQDAAAATGPLASQAQPAPAERIPFAGTRRMIADRMTLSVRNSAHVTLVGEVDATEAVKLREQLIPEWERDHGPRLSFTDLIVKACALALREHPRLNASLHGEEIVLSNEINVGIAVALPDSLLVPVVRQADAKPLRRISTEAHDLVERARRGALLVDEVAAGTFTVTNLGGLGIDFFTPIINPPETAILGMGRIAERPAVHGGEICKRSLMYLSLSFDHRVVDGAPAAAFLRRVRDLLERPYTLLA